MFVQFCNFDIIKVIIDIICIPISIAEVVCAGGDYSESVRDKVGLADCYRANGF